jgi:hypothetical protein
MTSHKHSKRFSQLLSTEFYFDIFNFFQKKNIQAFFIVVNFTAILFRVDY